jgi:hypothetical protein
MDDKWGDEWRLRLGSAPADHIRSVHDPHVQKMNVVIPLGDVIFSDSRMSRLVAPFESMRVFLEKAM